MKAPFWPLLITMGSILSLIVPPILAAGCFLWWRRARHWSFLVLFLAVLLVWIPGVLQTIVVNVQLFGLTEEQVVQRQAMEGWWRIQMLAMVLSYICALIGAAGLISASLDPFLMELKANAREEHFVSDGRDK